MKFDAVTWFLVIFRQHRLVPKELGLTVADPASIAIKLTLLVTKVLTWEGQAPGFASHWILDVTLKCENNKCIHVCTSCLNSLLPFNVFQDLTYYSKHTRIDTIHWHLLPSLITFVSAIIV